MHRFRHPTVGLYEVWRSEMLRQAALPLEKHFSVCDIGCGLGYHCFRLEQEVAKVHGFDISEEMIAWLQRYSRRQTIFECLDICGGDVGRYKNRFDKVFCNDVYEHIEDPRRMLTNVYHMLKADGLIVITFPNHTHHGHNHINRASELAEQFKDAGFVTCRIEIVLDPGVVYTRWLNWFERLRGWTDYLPNIRSHVSLSGKIREADHFHESLGFRKSQYLQQIPLLSSGINLLMWLFTLYARHYPIYQTAIDEDIREKRLLVIAQK